MVASQLRMNMNNILLCCYVAADIIDFIDLFICYLFQIFSAARIVFAFLQSLRWIQRQRSSALTSLRPGWLLDSCFMSYSFLVPPKPMPKMLPGSDSISCSVVLQGGEILNRENHWKPTSSSALFVAFFQAQERLDAQSDDEIGQALQHLAALARKLRAQRFEVGVLRCRRWFSLRSLTICEDGAIELEGGELKFEPTTQSGERWNLDFFPNQTEPWGWTQTHNFLKMSSSMRHSSPTISLRTLNKQVTFFFSNVCHQTWETLRSSCF